MVRHKVEHMLGHVKPTEGKGASKVFVIDHSNVIMLPAPAHTSLKRS